MTMTVGVVATIDDGTYAANLIALEDFVFGEGNEAKTLRRWKFGLDALDSEGNPAEIDGVSSLALGPKSKAYGWVTALMGRPLVEAEEITRSMLINRECLVEVYQKEGYSKIRNVVAAPRKRAAGTSPAGIPVVEAMAPVAETFPDSPPARLEAGALDVDDIPF